MKYLSNLLLACCLVTGIIGNANAQRAVGAHELILDDGAGHTLTLLPSSSMTSNQTFTFPPITSYTPGSVLFADINGSINQDNAKFFWDNINDRLGIGNATPSYNLDITGNLRVSNSSIPTAVLQSSSTIGTWLSIGNSAAGHWFDLISTGSANGEGPGKLLLYTADGATSVFGKPSLCVAWPSGNVGIGDTAPASLLSVGTSGSFQVDNSGTVKMGPTANLYASGGEENLRILRGVIDGSGNIMTGTGFTVTHNSTGSYTINFTTNFSSPPSVVVTPANGPVACGWNLLNVNHVTINIWDLTGTSTDQWFNFIAIGPR